MKTKFNGILTLLLAFVVQFSFAQERTISGTVSDVDGPLPGVTIIIKGTTTGVDSDFDGNYSIQAKTGDVLQFNYVGYEDVEKTIGVSNKIDVLMKSGGSIGEVVVTALGIKKEEKSIGYASQQVKSENLTRVRDANIVNSLSGKVAGVSITNSSGAVGASSRINIRGISTIFGNDQPLMVVDGVIIDNTNYGSSGSSGGTDAPNGLADLNQDDIETINVLKGGAATSLYGMRGANGVIVITTKSGKNNEKLGITINSSVSFENAYVLPNYQNSYGQGHNPAYFEFRDGYGYDGGSASGDGGTDESWGPALDAGLEFIQWNSFDGNPTPWVSYKDNVKDFFETGITTNNNISFSSGGESYNTRLSVGLTDTKGIIYNTDLKKYNIAGKLNFDLSEKWKAGVSISYIKTESGNLPSVGYGDSNNQLGQLVWSARNVDYQALKDYKNLPVDPISGTPINWNMLFNNNPYWALDNNVNTFDRNRMLGNFNLSYDISDSFSVSFQSGIDYFNSLNSSREAFGTYEATNGSYNETQRTRYEVNTQVLLNYETSLTEDLDFSLTVGGNKMVNNYHRLFLSAPELQLPGLYNISNTRDGVNPVQAQDQVDQKINSFIGFGQFNYKNYLFLDFTARNDWASVLPISNNSFFYPSVSASAVLSDMFEMNRDYVSFLKLRGSWAKVGSAGPLSPYSIEPSYSYSSSPWGTTPVAFLPGTLWNPNIKNQDSQEFEIGLDGRLLKNRMRFGITYYDKTTEDVILPKQVSSTSGFSNAWQNAATITNKGIELTFGADIIKNDDGFNFGLDINFAKNNNLVTDIDDDPTTDNGIVNLGSLWRVSVQAREGLPMGALFGPAFERDPASGEIIYENGLPQIDATYKVLGNINADWTGGLALDMSYKGFQLNTLFDVKSGGEIYSQTNSWGKLAGVLEETLVGRETGLIGQGVMLSGGSYVPNNVTVSAFDYFQTAYSQNIAESSVYDASFVKWRELSLAYNLPKSLFANIGVDAVKFGVSVRNLAILYKKVPHIDPESAFSNSVGDQGLEYAQIPSTRSIAFNLNLKF